jgi:glycosyltransferase involved in cell wall biosynthesis
VKVRTLQSKRYNILYLDSGSGIGGGQRSLLLLLKHLDATRFRSFLGCLGDSMLAAAARTAGHPVIPLDLPKQHDKGDKTRRFTFDDITRDLQQLKVIFQLLGVLQENQIDLIHANSLAAGLIGGVAAKLYGIPVIMHKRYATAYGVLDRICEVLLDRVILVSEATRWTFAPHSKQALIYNGVELSSFRPPLSRPRQRGGKTLRADLDLDPDALLIGIVTRITPEKGIHLLIEATAKLKASSYIQLLVVGGPYFPKDAEYIDSLKVQAKKLGIANRVIFTGFLEDTGAILSILDILLLASTIPEACPRTIIEAMAAGVPVIATPLGGSKELVTPETGILVPAEDADAFADAITQLSEDAERRKRMGKACRLRAEQLFCATQNARLTEDLYLDLL